MYKLCASALALLFVSAFGVASHAAAPNQGLTSPVHKTHAGKVAFAHAAIAFKTPNPKDFKTTMKWADPIYGRVYMPHSIAVAYEKKGWDFSKSKLGYVWEVTLGGKVIYSRFNETNKAWSTFQLGWKPAASDTYKWPERHWLWRVLPLLQAGKNTLRFTFHAARRAPKGTFERAQLMASGALTLDVPADVIKKAAAGAKALESMEPRYRNSSDAWKQWKIAFGSGSGTLEPRYMTAKDAWTQWKYALPGKVRGTIDTRYRSGSGMWRDWVLTTSTKRKIQMATRYRSGKDINRTWTVTAGKEQWNIEARWRTSDFWKEWIAKGPGGASLHFVVRYKGAADAWKDWRVIDKATTTDPELKMAVAFVVLHASSAANGGRK